MFEIDKEEKQIDNMYSNFSKGLGRNSPVKQECNFNDLRIKKSKTTMRKFSKNNHNYSGHHNNHHNYNH